MKRTALFEFLVLGLCVAIFLSLLLPAAQYARRKDRDDTRKEQLAKTKIEIEQYNNKYKKYPVSFPAAPFEYIVTENDGHNAISWFIRMPMENADTPKVAFDKEADRNYLYRIAKEGNKTFYDIAGGNETFGKK